MAKGKTPPDKPKSPKSGTGVGRNGNLHPKPWKKGDPSPNPSGRPKGIRSRSTILNELLDHILKQKNEKTGKYEPVINPLNPDEKTMSVEKAMDVAIIRRALNGNVEAYREIKDTVYGEKTKKVEMGGIVDGAPLAVQFVDDI